MGRALFSHHRELGYSALASGLSHIFFADGLLLVLLFVLPAWHTPGGAQPIMDESELQESFVFEVEFAGWVQVPCGRWTVLAMGLGSWLLLLRRCAALVSSRGMSAPPATVGGWGCPGEQHSVARSATPM